MIEGGSGGAYGTRYYCPGKPEFFQAYTTGGAAYPMYYWDVDGNYPPSYEAESFTQPRYATFTFSGGYHTVSVWVRDSQGNIAMDRQTLLDPGANAFSCASR
jgi:hypothetical protein